MSFSASAKRARDSSQPIGLRVACLHECLEQFSLFGFQTTRERLRSRLGVSAFGWTDGQILAALDLLEPARRSWSAFLADGQQRQRIARRLDSNVPPLDDRALKIDWLGSYLRGDTAQDWLVAGLGSCPSCSHELIYHGGYACAACSVEVSRRFASPQDRAAAWEQRCPAPMPSPLDR